jgi:methylated-DNA-[protein]-cysteine S-methyltransferase
MASTSVLAHDTPVGRLTLAASDRGLTRLSYRGVRSVAGSDTAGPAAGAWLDLARRELDDYFAGRLRQFNVPVDLHRVDDARRRILDALADVGYGETTTYGALAARLGLVDDGPRQVGVAMARNPVAIVVPCHRVLGAGGNLTGYGGGLANKRALLDLEGRDRPGQLTIAI